MFDYRKIIGTRNFRVRVLSSLSWIPDKLMLRLQYFLQTGEWLHLRHPVKFNEKIQAYKLHYRNPEMLRCVDKYEVREYVREKGLEDILVPLIGVYENPKEIDFEKLPEKFVIKSSDGAGGNEIIICRNKETLDSEILYNALFKWMSVPKPAKHIAREWAYENNYPRKIIIEKLLEEPFNNSVTDYKFFCFNGKFGFLWVDKDRFGSHQRGFWDENFNFLPEVKCDYPTFEKEQPLPSNIEDMRILAEKLSKGFPFARIDLYNIKGKIYFSEITFYPNSGYKPYHPYSFDLKISSYFKLPN